MMERQQRPSKKIYFRKKLQKRETENVRKERKSMASSKGPPCQESSPGRVHCQANLTKNEII